MSYNRRGIIEAAINLLNENADLRTQLNFTGSVQVRLPKRQPIPVTLEPITHIPIENSIHIVTFTIINHPVLGRRLTAKFEGIEEFVA